MKHIMPIRKSLPHRTIFNLLGPLCNPAGVQKQFIGVYDPQMITKVTKVLAKIGSKKAMVVCGRDGLDEITLADTTYVSYFDGRAINSYELASSRRDTSCFFRACPWWYGDRQCQNHL